MAECGYFSDNFFWAVDNPCFFDNWQYICSEETSENVRVFVDNDSEGLSGTGEIIGRDEEPFIIVRQWAGMESMNYQILITKTLWSGLSNRFVKLNIVVSLHKSKSPISNRPMEKKIPSKDRFFVDTKKLVFPYNFIHNSLKLKRYFVVQTGIKTLLIQRRQHHR